MRPSRREVLDHLVSAQVDNARLRDLLRALIATHRLTNRYHEALLLVPHDMWVDLCLEAGVDPSLIPGGGPDSAVGEAAAGPAAAGDAPPHPDTEGHP